jgi:uncharacterized protein (DUF2141 family)
MFKIVSFILLSIFSYWLLDIRPSNEGTLTISSEGFNNNKGKAVLFIFRQRDEIPGSPFKISTTSIREGKAQFQVQNLPFNDYAIILLHDENNNQKIDHSLGFPSEQLGYSNNWTFGIFSGMPTFSKLKFQFSPNSQSLTINVTYKK